MNKRKFIKTALAGSLLKVWTPPIVTAVALPVHAQTSELRKFVGHVHAEFKYSALREWKAVAYEEPYENGGTHSNPWHFAAAQNADDTVKIGTIVEGVAGPIGPARIVTSCESIHTEGSMGVSAVSGEEITVHLYFYVSDGLGSAHGEEIIITLPRSEEKIEFSEINTECNWL